MIEHINHIIELNFLMLKWCSKMSYEDQLLYIPKIKESIEYAVRCLETAKEIFKQI